MHMDHQTLTLSYSFRYLEIPGAAAKEGPWRRRRCSRLQVNLRRHLWKLSYFASQLTAMGIHTCHSSLRGNSWDVSKPFFNVWIFKNFDCGFFDDHVSHSSPWLRSGLWRQTDWSKWRIDRSRTEKTPPCIMRSSGPLLICTTSWRLSTKSLKWTRSSQTWPFCGPPTLV